MKPSTSAVLRMTKKPAYRAEIDNKRNIATEVIGAARSLGTRRHVSPWSAKTTKIAE